LKLPQNPGKSGKTGWLQAVWNGRIGEFPQAAHEKPQTARRQHKKTGAKKRAAR